MLVDHLHFLSCALHSFIFLLSNSIFREGNGNPLQYSCLENPMDGGAWWATVHGVPKSWTRLGDFTFTFHFHALEKEMATHSSVLAWRIPGPGEPGGLPSMGSHRVGYDRRNLAAAATTPFSIICRNFVYSLNTHTLLYSQYFPNILTLFVQHHEALCREMYLSSPVRFVLLF